MLWYTKQLCFFVFVFLAEKMSVAFAVQKLLTYFQQKILELLILFVLEDH